MGNPCRRRDPAVAATGCAQRLAPDDGSPGRKIFLAAVLARHACSAAHHHRSVSPLTGRAGARGAAASFFGDAGGYSPPSALCCRCPAAASALMADRSACRCGYLRATLDCIAVGANIAQAVRPGRGRHWLQQVRPCWIASQQRLHFCETVPSVAMGEGAIPGEGRFSRFTNALAPIGLSERSYRLCPLRASTVFFGSVTCLPVWECVFTRLHTRVHRYKTCARRGGKQGRPLLLLFRQLRLRCSYAITPSLKIERRFFSADTPASAMYTFNPACNRF